MHEAKFWQVVQNARFCIVLEIGEIPKGAWRSDLDSVRNVMQIDAFHGAVRANSMLSHFSPCGSDLGRFGVVFLLGRCAARTVGNFAPLGGQRGVGPPSRAKLPPVPQRMTD